MAEKTWGGEPFWGLGYEWDPDWVLTERQRELRDTLIELCEKERRANAKVSDDELRFPRRNLELLGEHGFLALTVPTEYGGLGENPVAYAMTCSWKIALAVGIVEPMVQTLAFAVHERVWSGKSGAKAPDLSMLDPYNKLAKTFDRRRIIGAVIYSANEVIEPGVIMNHVPGNNMLVVGEADDRQTDRIQSLRRILEESGMSSPAAPDIRAAIWSKLVQNLTNSTLTTLTGATVAQVRSDAALFALSKKINAEGQAIAQAYGINLSLAPQRPGAARAGPALARRRREPSFEPVGRRETSLPQPSARSSSELAPASRLRSCRECPLLPMHRRSG